MEIEYYIMEVEGEGCYCLCYDDVNGNRVVVDWDLEIREDQIVMREELEKIVKRYYESELEKYKEESDESDEECKWNVSEFVTGEIDEILGDIIEEK